MTDRGAYLLAMRISTAVTATVITLLAAVSAVATVADAQRVTGRRAAAASRPDLIVFITVDQMRPDYLTRFLPQLTAGLGRLYRGGAVFTNAFQDHAITETAPGHSETMSGRFPVHTGIAMNSAGVNDTTVSLVNAPGPGASPARFRGTTLTDWIRAADPKSRSLSVSRKDRGAILPIGKSKSSVFWYATNGAFTTSTYYATSLPAWLDSYNATHRAASFTGKTWNPLLPAGDYAEPDSVPIENGGKDFTFPHVISSDTARALAALASYPWMDQLTLEVALAGVRAMKLGAGPHTDLLAVSLSATDYIGHTYGPDSREQHDQILRLDRALGAFMDSLYAIHGNRNIVFALTADHGVAPYPSQHVHDANTGATYVDIGPRVADVRASLQTLGVQKNAFAFSDGVLTIDRAELAAAHVNADSLVLAFRDMILKVPGVRRADRIRDLVHADTVHDNVARRWLHMFDSDSVYALVVTLTPYSYWGKPGGSAEHGSPYDYDAHVPMIFYGAPFKPGKYAERVRVVDMAPTLARVVGVAPLQKIDGHALTAAAR
jgi:predicted AlkP superfamily pyrophosphatase or phosphodiesterase